MVGGRGRVLRGSDNFHFYGQVSGATLLARDNANFVTVLWPMLVINKGKCEYGRTLRNLGAL